MVIFILTLLVPLFSSTEKMSTPPGPLIEHARKMMEFSRSEKIKSNLEIKKYVAKIIQLIDSEKCKMWVQIVTLSNDGICEAVKFRRLTICQHLSGPIYIDVDGSPLEILFPFESRLPFHFCPFLHAFEDNQRKVYTILADSEIYHRSLKFMIGSVLVSVLCDIVLDFCFQRIEKLSCFDDPFV